MFIPVVFKDKDGSYIEHINVTHITRLSFVNSLNPDAGTNIHLRTGEVLVTQSPMDIMSERIDNSWQCAASLVIFNVIAEKAKMEIDENPKTANKL